MATIGDLDVNEGSFIEFRDRFGPLCFGIHNEKVISSAISASQ
tara:strand:+ start:526 stop:654 length:129 start_codon:yes stop_codon:yes gene_type:complete